MTDTLTVQQASRELADDLRRLHHLTGRLPGARDAAEIAEVLSELHGALTRHFNEEERPGGLYDALGVCAPEFRSRLAVLVDDHFRFAGLVRDLRERARGGGAGSLPGLRADVAGLVAALEEHERREHEMVQMATSGRS